MSEEERKEIEQLKNTVNELSTFIAQNFNPDGSLKKPPVVVEASDSVTTPVGTIRIQTSLGPKNVLIAA